MNLSSYLQMPPAPLVPTNTPNAVPQGARSGVGPSAGNNLGFDFADVMARQLQRLVPQQRQSIAADTSEQAQQASDKQDSRPVEDHHAYDSTERDMPHTHTDTRADRTTDENKDDRASTQRHKREKNAAQKQSAPMSMPSWQG